ncbi:MAG: tetratricopeptide repeat protein [Betaproteobacteria bacterium]|nr:tetratricopeptide repeat protein [Betaproteobacteria bacterium]
MDATLATFERDVLEASRDAPVVVDFWAPWCGPCRALGPLLEKLERESGGRWKLVKVNSDENAELSAQFGVRSIPFVVAFVDGRPVSQFLGAQPEGTIRAFLDKLVPDPSELELRHARAALASGQASLAEDHLRNAIALDPSNDAARLDMVAILMDRRDLAGARVLWPLLSPKAPQASAYATVLARLEAAERAATLPAAGDLERRIEADPGDLGARLDLAEVRIANREFGPALEQLLEIVRRDRAFGDDVGRRKILAVFEMAADQPDLVADYRRRLSATLY